jgi:hypothetical protein
VQGHLFQLQICLLNPFQVLVEYKFSRVGLSAARTMRLIPIRLRVFIKRRFYFGEMGVI